jgi:hypothetical protein
LNIKFSNHEKKKRKSFRFRKCSKKQGMLVSFEDILEARLDPWTFKFLPSTRYSMLAQNKKRILTRLDPRILEVWPLSLASILEKSKNGSSMLDPRSSNIEGQSLLPTTRKCRHFIYIYIYIVYRTTAKKSSGTDPQKFRNWPIFWGQAFFWG